MNREVKQVRIFVNSYTYKILRRDYGYVDRLKVRKRFQIIGHRDNATWERRSENPDGSWKEITIEGPSMDLHKAYFIIRAIEEAFRDKMNIYVLGATKAGLPSRAALREFIEVYDILEEELKLDSCYKDWSRFKAKNHRRDRIPLWI
jgi:hypothetical protein